MAKHKDLYFSLKRNFKIVLSPHSVLESKGQGRGLPCIPAFSEALLKEAVGPGINKSSRLSPWRSSFHSKSTCFFDGC